MPTVLMSALTPELADPLRRTPELVNLLRRFVRSGELTPSVDFGQLDQGRLGRLEKAFDTAAWPLVRRIIDGEMGDSVRYDANILTREDITLLARALKRLRLVSAARKGAAEDLARRFRALVLEIEEQGIEMLVIGTTIFERRAAIARGYAMADAHGVPRLAEAGRNKPPIASLLQRGLTKHDATVLREMLHVGGALRGDDPEKRKAAYEALRAIFFDRDGFPRRFVADEIPTLWNIVITPTYSKHSRGLAALLGAHAMKSSKREGGSGLEWKAAKPLLLALGPKFFSQVLDELDSGGRLALALWGVFVGFGRNQVLSRVPSSYSYKVNWAFSAEGSERWIEWMFEESERALLGAIVTP